jgi:hypothetical protein
MLQWMRMLNAETSLLACHLVGVARVAHGISGLW